ncbi:hypothetical protein IJT17_06460 [bacterium]|nr:hypothetical protein [bacterium]
MKDNIVALLDKLGYEYSVSSKYDSYEVNLYFDDNRKQGVYIRRKIEEVSGIAFREIWSPACYLPSKLSNAVAFRLLENNNYRAIGAWAYNSAEHMVYFSCKVTNNMTEDELDAILVAVASDADRLEQKLMGQDVL